MIMILLYSIIYLYIIFFDLIPIKKNNYNKLFKFNLFVILISFLIIVLVDLNFRVIYPSDLIENIVNVFIH